MLDYILFWTLLGFIIHFYIIFGTTPLGAPSTLVGPTLLLRRTFSSYIYLRTPKLPDTEPKPNSTAATFYTREIPSWGLFRRSAGGGIDHGGLLHQHRSLSNEV